MNPENLPLRDIHLPPEIGFWPPALGWWLLAFSILLLLAWWVHRMWRQSTGSGNQLLSPAWRELERIETHYRDDQAALIKALSVLLRRVAMTHYGRSKTAGLTGDAWLQLLDEGKHRGVFAGRFRQALTEMPYQAAGQANVGELLAEVRHWLKGLPE